MLPWIHSLCINDLDLWILDYLRHDVYFSCGINLIWLTWYVSRVRLGWTAEHRHMCDVSSTNSYILAMYDQGSLLTWTCVYYIVGNAFICMNSRKAADVPILVELLQVRAPQRSIWRELWTVLHVQSTLFRTKIGIHMVCILWLCMGHELGYSVAYF
jgi:hypothetical protein